MSPGMLHMEPKQNRNLKTGLILASIALVFFVAVIAKRVMLG